MRRGRPLKLEDYDWKVVKLPSLVWDKLQYLSERDGQPMHKIIEAALEEKYGLYSMPDNYIPLWEALNVVSRQIGKSVSPYKAVTAIRKGAVAGERRLDGKRYRWFVDLNGLKNYCAKRCSSKDKVLRMKASEIIRQRLEVAKKGSCRTCQFCCERGNERFICAVELSFGSKAVDSRLLRRRKFPLRNNLLRNWYVDIIAARHRSIVFQRMDVPGFWLKLCLGFEPRLVSPALLDATKQRNLGSHHYGYLSDLLEAWGLEEAIRRVGSGEAQEILDSLARQISEHQKRLSPSGLLEMTLD